VSEGPSPAARRNLPEEIRRNLPDEIRRNLSEETQ